MQAVNALGFDHRRDCHRATESSMANVAKTAFVAKGRERRTLDSAAGNLKLLPSMLQRPSERWGNSPVWTSISDLAREMRIVVIQFCDRIDFARLFDLLKWSAHG